MANGNTKSIDKSGEWRSLATLMSLSLSSGDTYAIQIQGTAEIKAGNAVFTIDYNKPFSIKILSDEWKIRTPFGGVVVTMLQDEE